ncbi:cupin domain-containing protein [Burkholderia lata]|uniref:cupin domain-containing protein n=1 Tax=Burkholderia lata (strain ATCC 17760 / DSM 23089 / LMG 22485 / NCIMB 9086 / R18194 / 383) TaxID=482957 RepID=UPI00399B7254
MSDMTSSHLTPSVSKQPAPSDIEQKMTGWDSWQCTGDTFSHRYVPGATFLVVRGRAKLIFKHGLELDIAQGDLVTIGEGAEVEWSISSPIETRYTYHPSGDAAGA